MLIVVDELYKHCQAGQALKETAEFNCENVLCGLLDQQAGPFYGQDRTPRSVANDQRASMGH
jgi:hypothetical protein